MPLTPRATATRTAWARSVRTPLARFVRTETSGAVALGAAALLALAWANVDGASYARVWSTELALRLGSHELAHDLRTWVDAGLMTLFFLVVGLEARRELDVGELRDRARILLPVCAGLAGMAVPALVFVAVNASSGTAAGWGAAISTDTAFMLGLVALVAPRSLGRLRVFLLAIVVADDVVALLVIATVYTDRVRLVPLALAVGCLALAAAARLAGPARGAVLVAAGLGSWLAMEASGVDPVVVGLVLGLLAYAGPAARGDLERATARFRRFREQPTPELAREARAAMGAALSPNDRLQAALHPWSSFVVVPLFALANAGVAIDGAFLRDAATSPVALGIVAAYVLGKPLGIAGGALLLARASGGRLALPVGPLATLGGGAVAGVPFTVSLLIAGRAFDGDRLREATLGVLVAVVLSALAGLVVFRGAARLPAPSRARALLGAAEPLVDLAYPVDPDRDRIRGALDAPVTLVEYGDLECPFCGQAEEAVRAVLGRCGDVRYVWRHLPLTDVHPRARLAAGAVEAAAEQGGFWLLHDALLARQDALALHDILRVAAGLGLDADRLARDLERDVGGARIDEDVDGADLSGVSGTPTFFVNGRRHHGAYDPDALVEAVQQARLAAVARG